MANGETTPPRTVEVHGMLRLESAGRPQLRDTTKRNKTTFPGKDQASTSLREMQEKQHAAARARCPML